MPEGDDGVKMEKQQGSPSSIGARGWSSYIQKCYRKIGGEGKMCTVGGGPDIGNIESLVAKDYECLECKNQFKGMGRRPMCPSCRSRNVKAV